MSRFFKSLHNKLSDSRSQAKLSDAPPEWAPAPGETHYRGKVHEAPGREYDDAESFCEQIPLDPPRLVPSGAVDRINEVGCAAWGIDTPTSSRFVGRIVNISDSKNASKTVTVETDRKCQDVSLFSNLPIIAGLYGIQGKTGVYYEICINKMDGIIAIGTACKPYPEWRLPGWNRMSAGFHLDDFCKFFEDADGGRDYTDSITQIRPGDTVGCGYIFQTGTMFFTYNGMRLPDAFTGIYLPRHKQDVFAAIGVEGRCEFQVNFGAELFRWKEGNEWAWRVEGHVGRLTGGPSSADDELPSYQQSGGL
ncbi:Protein ssh4 [Psilocybe cubensis]|uniref:B30.2/SPRY domain-containing protein n=2 Tax=Psilocybe cubensis TaxID=181762 RepID=A0A8H7XKZ2_PSICU|nr:Protein ssh4 [Psilocybe cubensis]KAH9477001.1 Protein ssh4 [Psilocybe cubensis]